MFTELTIISLPLRSLSVRLITLLHLFREVPLHPFDHFANAHLAFGALKQLGLDPFSACLAVRSRGRVAVPVPERVLTLGASVGEPKLGQIGFTDIELSCGRRRNRRFGLARWSFTKGRFHGGTLMGGPWRGPHLRDGLLTPLLRVRQSRYRACHSNGLTVPHHILARLGVDAKPMAISPPPVGFDRDRFLRSLLEPASLAESNHSWSFGGSALGSLTGGEPIVASLFQRSHGSNMSDHPGQQGVARWDNNSKLPLKGAVASPQTAFDQFHR